MNRSCYLVAIAAATAPLAATAHHSFVGFYDQEQIIEIEGEVASVSWRNPHGTITLDVTDDTGEVVPWRIETGSVSVLRVRGFDRDFMKVGDRVRIAGEPSLRNPNGLYARNLLLANGQEVLLSIGIKPQWTDAQSGELLAAQLNEEIAAEARQKANGIFRVWAAVFEDPDSFPMFKGNYPLTEAAIASKAQWDSSSVVQLGCELKGMPALMITPYPVDFIDDGDEIHLGFEEEDAVRVIHMDPNAAKPQGYSSAFGYSRGRWEGGSLVVETDSVDFDYFDSEGTPMSPNASFVEWFTVSEDEERLDYRISITDPATFTETFELARYLVWRPDLVVNPYDCVALEE